MEGASQNLLMGQSYCPASGKASLNLGDKYNISTSTSPLIEISVWFIVFSTAIFQLVDIQCAT